jgi:hypothetical protein
MKPKPFLVSHEVPIDFLYESRQFNDYDYCLPHLLDLNETYREYFYDSKRNGRFIIMDNSLHELGKAYDDSRLIYWINELKPDEFIVPDVWQDHSATMRNAKLWRDYYNQGVLPKETRLIAVGQGDTYENLITCLYVITQYHHYDKVALSYGASLFYDIFPHPNVFLGKMMGRIKVVSSLSQKEWFKEYELHLLGCSLPQEFAYYNYPEFSFIKTIDTSNPIIHGILGIEYNDYGLDSKSPIKIDTINETLNKDIVYRNVEKFTKILTHDI